MVQQLSVEEMDEQGIVFDWALPQSWYTDVLARIGKNPAGAVVWAYTQGSGLLGEPIAIDDRGREILEQVSAQALAG